MTTELWTAAAFNILVATFGVYILLSWLLTKMESSKVAVAVYLQPVLTLAPAWYFLGEAPTPRILVSGLVVCLGVYLAISQRRSQREGAGGPKDEATAGLQPAELPSG